MGAVVGGLPVWAHGALLCLGALLGLVFAAVLFRNPHAPLGGGPLGGGRPSVTIGGGSFLPSALPHPGGNFPTGGPTETGQDTTSPRPRPVCPPGQPHFGGQGAANADVAASSAGPVHIPACAVETPCPESYTFHGGYFCRETRACQSGAAGPIGTCTEQCYLGNPARKTLGASEGGAESEITTLAEAGCYDLRVTKGGRLMGCAAPVSLFGGNPKYGCAGAFDTAVTCDAAPNPVRDTQYVWVVHAGCKTAQGHGTYGYAYDDGIGLKQCAPVTKYDWVLCPDGTEGPITWEATQGIGNDTMARFRVTNKCRETIWIQQAGGEQFLLHHEQTNQRIEPFGQYTYSIPNRGMPSTRFLPKTGCDDSGNGCDIQSMPPCPAQGCDIPIDTKFEASWGCLYARQTKADKVKCAITGQGNPSTYQDWWDGSAVDGWTLPFSILVDDGNHGLSPFTTEGSPASCVGVVCDKLDAGTLCPSDEYLTP